MMDIKILGTGCPKCRTLFENAQAAVAAAGIEARIDKVEKITEIIAYGVMTTPAVVVNGEVRSAGKVLTPEQFMGLISPK